ncbi:DnaJ family domain-containing protein [Herbiconiux daphne]|uniref:DUF1992 domain-containing protein n=1 Tax=Herbiconiux daphne TaxID=2970914 RepID=A0ABT2H2I1_9MICO|nr:DUF1992 domain-containing protein [Herbiconiux daphne]MCS5734120.1 DUF1992 domain-containing protein [Herbiconiux daphne]
MAGKRERSDSRLNVARYRVERLAHETGDDEALPAVGAGQPEPEGDNDAGRPTMEQRSQFVEIAIAQAMRRGDFDDLPGAGKPLTHLTQTHDPNWWIRRKIEREQLTGLGPPALTLRTENAGLDERLDAAPTENAVRDILTDFNARVIEARRQLLGGPPVVTPVRDVDDEVARWHERRAARRRAADEERERDAAYLASLSRRERRRVLRERRGL